MWPVGIHAITHTDNREAGDHHVIVQYFRNRPWIGHLCGHRQGLLQEAPTQAHRGGLRPVGHRCLRRHLRRFLRMERRHRPSRMGRLPHRRHRGLRHVRARRHRGLRHVRAHAQLDQRNGVRHAAHGRRLLVRASRDGPVGRLLHRAGGNRGICDDRGHHRLLLVRLRRRDPLRPHRLLTHWRRVPVGVVARHLRHLRDPHDDRGHHRLLLVRLRRRDPLRPHRLLTHWRRVPVGVVARHLRHLRDPQLGRRRNIIPLRAGRVDRRARHRRVLRCERSCRSPRSPSSRSSV